MIGQSVDHVEAGRVYLHLGRRVVVVARWRPPAGPAGSLGRAPRNLWLRRLDDGHEYVRPWRGLRRVK